MSERTIVKKVISKEDIKKIMYNKEIMKIVREYLPELSKSFNMPEFIKHIFFQDVDEVRKMLAKEIYDNKNFLKKNIEKVNKEGGLKINAFKELRINIINYYTSNREQIESELPSLEYIKSSAYAYITSKHLSDKAFGRQLIADYLIKKYNFCTILGEKMDEVYYYRDGIYVLGGTGIIKEEVEIILEDGNTTAVTTEILNKIKRMTRIERKDLQNVPLNLICLNNGIYDIEKNVFFPHDPKYKFLTKCRTNYVENSECPTILKVLSELLDDDSLRLVQEIAGYCLYRTNAFKKLFIFEGPADTGKTTFLEILRMMIGEENISTSNLQYLCDSKNGTATLYGKMANFYDDLDMNAINNPGRLKMITGNSFMPGERKYFDQFSFVNEATLVFTCNKIPETHNPDTAYYKRFILVLFKNEVPEEQIDRNLLKKLEPEISGFLKWAIKGLKRLLQNNKFSYAWSIQETMEYMQSSCSSIAKFVQECLEEDQNSYMTRQEIYNAYLNFCKLENITAEEQKTSRGFGIHFPRYCKFAQDGRKDIKGHKNARVWKSIKLKSSEMDDLEPNTIWNYKEQ